MRCMQCTKTVQSFKLNLSANFVSVNIVLAASIKASVIAAVLWHTL